MNRISAIEAIVDPSRVLAEATENSCGLVLFDFFGEVRKRFATILMGSDAVAMPGALRGIKSMASTEYAALAPLAAVLGFGLGGLFETSSGATEGQQIRRITSALRTGLGERHLSGPAPWLLLAEPQFLDQSSQRILCLLAEGGSVRLLIHVRRAWEVPRRFKRLLDNGLLSRVPDTGFGASDAVEVVSGAVGYRVPLLGALALHQLSGGQCDQVDLFVGTTPPDDLRRALFTGQMSMIEPAELLTRLIRREHRSMDQQLRTLIDAVTVHAHLPLHEAYLQWGRKTVEAGIVSGMLRRFRCGSTPVLCIVSPLAAGHLWAALTPYDLAAVHELGQIGNRCCRAGRPGSFLARGDVEPVKDPPELINALEAASEEHFMRWGPSLANRLRAMLPSPGHAQLRSRGAIALARHAYLRQGAHAALRELRAHDHAELIWNDQGTVDLVVQICLETGRLLPTARRIALMRGLGEPAQSEGPELLALLVPDRISVLAERGMRAIEVGDMRAAVAHLGNGLRLSAVSNPGPNAVALRVTLLSSLALSLALGGYWDGWQRLSGWLGLHRRPWHAQSLAAVELSGAMRELNNGALLSGAELLALTGECAGILGSESIRQAAAGMYRGLIAGTSVAPEDGEEYFVGSAKHHGRNQLEESQRAALMRHPEAVARLLRNASGYNDPRAIILRRSAEAQLGLVDPVAVAREALAVGQGFTAAWILDGLLARMLLADPEQGPWLVRLATVEGAEALGVVTELLAAWGSRGIPGVDVSLASVLAQLPVESFVALPFLAHEAALRSLTPREVEIAGLATAGLSNRQIARKLVLSLRTVEGHIASVMAKRGVGSRDELIPRH